jgi:arylsulfatase A-like enzyme
VSSIFSYADKTASAVRLLRCNTDFQLSTGIDHWSNDLSTDIPTFGDMLRRQAYYTAYKGKWHLTDEFETANDLYI